MLCMQSNEGATSNELSAKIKLLASSFCRRVNKLNVAVFLTAITAVIFCHSYMFVYVNIKKESKKFIPEEISK